MMTHWLGALPVWIIEGTAEYTSSMPFKSGKFHVSAVKSVLRRSARGDEIEPYPLEKLFATSPYELHALMAADPTTTRKFYYTSYLMVFYFMHLDGGGDGQRFVQYFRKLGELRKNLPEIRVDRTQEALDLLFGGRSEADLTKQVRSAFQKMGIRL
jgi:hypothetical protein